MPDRSRSRSPARAPLRPGQVRQIECPLCNGKLWILIERLAVGNPGQPSLVTVHRVCGNPDCGQMPH